MHPDFAEIASTVRVTGPGTIEIRRSTIRIGDASPGRMANYASAEDGVAATLYWNCYCRSMPRQLTRRDIVGERDFQAWLTRSNYAPTTWQQGWSIRSVTDARVEVLHNDISFLTTRGQVRTESWEPGHECMVQVPSERRHVAPGFYLFLGAAEPAGRPLVRLYWHLTAEGGPLFVGSVSRLLNEARIPFRAKTINHPDEYVRADAGVIYLDAADLERASEPIESIQAALAPFMRDTVPMFTKRLGPGLALACDPPERTSFGQVMCRFVARALVHAGPGAPPEDRFRLLSDVLTAAHVDVARPYIYGTGNDDATAIDSFAPVCRTVNPRTSATTAPIPVGDTSSDSDTLVDAAASIGESILERAFWNSNRQYCNWIGRVAVSPANAANAGTQRVAAMGPDLYGGLSGVAAYLSELFALSGDQRFREASCAALRNALSQLKLGQSRYSLSDLGFYSGAAGVVLAAARVGRQVGLDYDTESLVSAFLDEADAEWPAQDHDLIYGRAGLTLALLSLSGYHARERCLGVAKRFGNQMSELLTSSVGAHPSESSPTLLSGLAHGAAGVGVALLELYRTTGDQTFLASGRAAFAYEDALFDDTQRNWPDLRSSSRNVGEVDGPRFLVAWCYGAPGLALALARAGVVDTERREWYSARTTAALDTTLAALKSSQARELADLSLCHGVAGLVESLLYSDAEGQRDHGDIARSVGAQIAAGRLAGRPWQSGVLCGGPNDSLMLGLSGVGLTLLRLVNPHIPSPLLPIGY
jgi:hypothetical protein